MTPTDRLPPLARPVDQAGHFLPTTDRPEGTDQPIALRSLAIIAWLVAAWLFVMYCIPPIVLLMLGCLVFKIVLALVAADARAG